MNDIVSIIMPSYNTADFIAESIESVLIQTYKNWELIIVDDCSTDDTYSVVSEYLSDERIRYLKNEKNSGAALSRNRALREAQGRWIAFLDSDDIWLPDKLEKQISFMEKNNYSFTYTKYEEIDENSNLIGRCIGGPQKIKRRGMYNFCWPGCLTVMYDSRKVGLIQISDIKKNNDYAMWLKVNKKEECYLLDETLGRYRRRCGSISDYDYITLISWHYRLFLTEDKKTPIVSMFFTIRNIVFGIYKKVKYVKKDN